MNKVLTDLDRGDILSRIETMVETMTRSDVKIARYLLASPHEFVRSSVRAIAADLDISEPTIMRFCRTIGSEGFKDLKFRLIQELALSQAISDQGEKASQLAYDLDTKPFDQNQIYKRVFDGAVESLTLACQAAEGAVLFAAGQAIASASRVVVYGIGGSSAVLAQEVHNRLFRLNTPVMVFTDGYAQRMSASILTKGDVALFVSSTGRPRELQESMELAKYYGATCIAITDKDTPLGREADICLAVGLSASGSVEFQPNPMRFAQLFIIDALAYCVAFILGESAHLSLRKTRGSIAWLHGIAPQQPIGD